MAQLKITSINIINTDGAKRAVVRYKTEVIEGEEILSSPEKVANICREDVSEKFQGCIVNEPFMDIIDSILNTANGIIQD